MMPRLTRKQLLELEQQFKAALAKAGMSQEQWRTRRYPVSRTHLNDVFRGRKRLFGQLESAILRFIKEQGV